MELSMDNMDIVAGGILAIMLALFMLTVIVTLFALSHRIRLFIGAAGDFSMKFDKMLLL